jgi:hypothetical protein
MSGITGTQVEQLYSLPAAITKNTYTTEAAFTGVAGTNTLCTLPGNWLLNDVPNPVGRTLKLEVEGTIGQTASATFAVNLGHDTAAGTKVNSLAVMAATTPPLAGTAPFHFYAYYTVTAFATTTFSVQVNGRWIMESVASGGVASASSLAVGFQGLITGLVPTTTYFIELFGTWSASSASNTTTINQMNLFGNC